jgi:hypothetical protein
MKVDREINRNRQMWEVLNVFPIKIGKLTPEERRKRVEQSLNRIRADIKLSSSTIKEVFPSSE